MPELNGIPLVPQEKQQAKRNPLEHVVMNDLDSDSERARAINDAIITGVGFLMITVDALDTDGGMKINYKKINKEDVTLSKSS
tara:strand:- start:545 stop:793 length:249 start_codon:yes stop_codon:yes gene_type:complete